MADDTQGDVGLYYEFVTVSLLRNLHGVNTLITIPLKTASQHFTMHKLIVFPTRFLEHKFIEILHDFA